jgi:hypothetical protein
MTRKRAKSATLGWFAALRTLEASWTPPFGFRIPQQNVIVYANPW